MDTIIATEKTPEGANHRGPVPRRTEGFEALIWDIGESVAVVGVPYGDIGKVRAVLQSLSDHCTIVYGFGGASDEEISRVVKERALSSLVHPIRPHKWIGKHPEWVRDNLIVRDCDRLVAFWDGVPGGVEQVIDLAIKAGKKVDIHCGGLHVVIEKRPREVRGNAESNGAS